MSWTKEQHITKSNDRVDICRKAVGSEYESGT